MYDLPSLYNFKNNYLHVSLITLNKSGIRGKPQIGSVAILDFLQHLSKYASKSERSNL